MDGKVSQDFLRRKQRIETRKQKSKMALPREGDPTTAAFGGYERSDDIVEIGAMSPDQPMKGKKSPKNDFMPEQIRGGGASF